MRHEEEGKMRGTKEEKEKKTKNNTRKVPRRLEHPEPDKEAWWDFCCNVLISASWVKVGEMKGWRGSFWSGIAGKRSNKDPEGGADGGDSGAVACRMARCCGPQSIG